MPLLRARSPLTTEATVPLTDPGLDEDDPKQLVFRLCRGSGLTIVLHAALPAERLLEEALSLSRVFGDSSIMGRGFATLRRDPQTVWTVVEGPAGSAVIMVTGPDSDSDFIIGEIFTPAIQSPGALEVSPISQGMGDAEVVALIAAAEVVPPWDLDPLRHLAADSGYDSLPVALRRTVREAGWRRLTHDMYGGELADDDLVTWLGFVRLQARQPVLEVGAPSPSPSASAALKEQGFTLQAMDDDQVLIGTSLPAQADLDTIRLVLGTVAAALASAQGTPPLSLPLPDAPSAASLWDRLENPLSMSAGRAGAHWVSTVPEFSYTERFCEDLPEGARDFVAVDEAAARLMQQTGAGFEESWRDQSGMRLDPPWFTTTSAVLDAQTGRVVLAGRLSHRAMGEESAYDLGAIDGRNGSSFARDGHTGGLYYPISGVYVGSSTTGCLIPFALENNVSSVDYHAPSETVALCESWGSAPGSVSVIGPDGRHRRLTYLEDVSSGEVLEFSPDGTWILVAASRDSILVEVATGRFLRLPGTASACWWPLRDSSLLVLENSPGRVAPRVFDLENGTYAEDLPVLHFDCEVVAELSHTFHPHVSHDGTELLALTFAGHSVAYQREHGARPHVVRVDLATGGAVVSQPFWVDEQRLLEREHSRPLWTTRPEPRPMKLGVKLSSQIVEPTLESTSSVNLWTDEAVALASKAMGVLIDELETDAAPDRLMPEVLAAATAAARDPEAFPPLATWLTKVQVETTRRIAEGRITGGSAATWEAFSTALNALKQGRIDLVDASVWARALPGHTSPSSSPSPAPTTALAPPRVGSTPERETSVRELAKGANAALDDSSFRVSLSASAESLDLSALLLGKDAKVRRDDDLVFYNNPRGTGVTSDSGTSTVLVDLASVPADIELIRIAVSTDDQLPLARFEPFRATLSADSGQSTVFTVSDLAHESAAVVFELYRRAGAWKVRAVGQGYDDGFRALLAAHGLEAD